MNKHFYTTDSIRESEKLNKIICDDTKKSKNIILTSSSDVGVMRNLGRNGSRYAPQAVLAQLKNLQFHQQEPIGIKEVASYENELLDFGQAQLAESNEIKKLIHRSPIHIGGGHDHIYPLLKACEENFENIVVLNIDAHCDTRKSPHPHSGTPFRQFAEETKKNFLLYQYGIHFFANSQSTLSLDKNIMSVTSFNDAMKLSQNFGTLPAALLSSIKQQFNDKTFFILSLDCDAIDPSIMEGVSAVNHQGLPLAHIKELCNWYKALKCQKAMGIYEYNPVFDRSSKGSRALASVIYDLLV